MLESFLPFDLDAAYAGAVILQIAPVIGKSLTWARPEWKDQLYVVIDDMVSHGNLTALARKSEIRKLEEILECLRSREESHVLSHGRSAGFTEGVSPTSNMEAHNEPAPEVGPQANTEEISLVEDDQFYSPHASEDRAENAQSEFDYTAEQFMAVAAGLDLEGFEWLLNTD